MPFVAYFNHARNSRQFYQGQLTLEQWFSSTYTREIRSLYFIESVFLLIILLVSIFIPSSPNVSFSSKLSSSSSTSWSIYPVIHLSCASYFHSSLRPSRLPSYILFVVLYHPVKSNLLFFLFHYVFYFVNNSRSQTSDQHWHCQFGFFVVSSVDGSLSLGDYRAFSPRMDAGTSISGLLCLTLLPSRVIVVASLMLICLLRWKNLLGLNSLQQTEAYS